MILLPLPLFAMLPSPFDVAAPVVLAGVAEFSIPIRSRKSRLITRATRITISEATPIAIVHFSKLVQRRLIWRDTEPFEHYNTSYCAFRMS